VQTLTNENVVNRTRTAFGGGGGGRIPESRGLSGRRTGRLGCSGKRILPFQEVRADNGKRRCTLAPFLRKELLNSAILNYKKGGFL